MGKILQFGTGRFLRGFFDCIVEEPRSITVVQSHPGSSGAKTINDNPGGYHVWTRGKLGGAVIDTFECVNSLDLAMVASENWNQLVQMATDPELSLIVSNTTEMGLALDRADEQPFDFRNQCPVSFPAKLAAILSQRFESGLGGLTILPMELIEYNANRLLTLVKQQAALFREGNASEEFVRWLEKENRWLNNLVDRIVVDVSQPPPWAGNDPLAVVAEPYRLLAIEDDGKTRAVLPNHPMIEWADDLKRIFTRKVRILNGLHTAMVAHSLPRGFQTVLDAVTDQSERIWLDSLLKEEILPALSARGIHETEFANAVMERFENPFFQHALTDIAKGHDQKLKTRISPTIDDFQNAFGHPPTKLVSVLTGEL